VKPEPFGAYTLVEWLAAGGMGEVYLAKAGRPGFERLFAVKRILAQHADSDEFVRLLVNEARISVQLNHPNIAQVFEFGSIGRHFFLAMEYVEGLSLSSLLKRGRDRGIRMPVADAVFIAMQICRALHYAHTRCDPSGMPLRIVHRDVSPHNVLLDEAGSVKLIDFGVARASETLVKTEAASVRGKIPYMSPEQARGENLDGRSDLYAVALVLYECLVYEPMFRAGNSLQTLKSVQAGEIEPLEPVLGSKVPPSLIALLDRALKMNPDERFGSAAELERALSYVLHELEPGHTSQRLAEVIAALDPERPVRKKLLLEALSSSLAHPDVEAPGPATMPDAVSVVLDTGALAGAPRAADDGPRAALAVAVPAPSPPAAARSGLVVGVVAALVLGAVGGIAVLRGAVEPAATPLPPTAPVAASVRAVRIVSEPPGARVLVNGLWRGQAPVEIPDLPMDAPALIRLELDGFEASETLLAPRVTAPLQVTLVARAAAAGSASTNRASPDGRSAPAGSPRRPPAAPPPPPAPVSSADACVVVNVVPWAHVSENGTRLGTTPLPCLRLPPGRHRLRLENPALGVARDVDVDVVAGTPARVTERF
jgi:serine/threonine protein kinase